MDSTLLASIVTFGLVALLVAGPYYLFVLRQETAEQDMIRQRIRTGGAAIERVSGATTLLREVERLSAIGPLHRMLAGDSAVATRLRDDIQLAGVTMTPGQLVLGSACLALAAYLAVVWRVGVPAIAVAAAVSCGAAPYGILRLLRARRLAKFEEQFPEAVDLIARTLRAGHAFTTGIGMAAEELPQPVASEFKLLYDQQNYGLPLNDGLRNLARRIPLIDAKFFVTAVLTQREAGGNLAEVLDNLAAVIRERFRIKRQLRVITAHGRMTGMVLAGLPPALAGYMFLTMPDHLHILMTDPTGIHMIVVALGLQALGAFLIYKISNVEY